MKFNNIDIKIGDKIYLFIKTDFYVIYCKLINVITLDPSVAEKILHSPSDGANNFHIIESFLKDLNVENRIFYTLGEKFPSLLAENIINKIFKS